MRYTSLHKAKRLLLPLIALAIISAAAVTILSYTHSFKVSPSSLPTTSGAPTSQPNKQPKLIWSEQHLHLTLSPGESASRTVTFTSSAEVQGIVIQPVPEITRFLTIQPNGSISVQSNQPQAVHLSFSIPPGTTLGTYEGTIHVRSGRRTLPQTLKLAINIVPQNYQTYMNPDLGITLNYPGDWVVLRQSLSSATFSNVSEFSSDLVSEIEAFFHIQVRLGANPQELPIDPWYNETLAANEPSPAISRTNIQINGRPAVKIEAAEVGTFFHIFVPRNPDVVEIVYPKFTPAFTGIYENMLASLRFAP